MVLFFIGGMASSVTAIMCIFSIIAISKINAKREKIYQEQKAEADKQAEARRKLAVAALAQKSAPAPASIPAQDNAVDAPKPNAGLNALLFVGCFLFMFAVFYGFSLTNPDLAPTMVLLTTVLFLAVGCILRKFVSFLKPASSAFAISSLCMFIFWFPALASLGLNGATIAFITFVSFFFSSAVASLVFNHTAYWHTAFLGLAATFISLFSFIDEVADFKTPYFSLYGTSIVLPALAVLYHWAWRKRCAWVPVAMRGAVASCSFIYLIIGAFVAFIASASGLAPFCASLTAAFAILFALIDMKYLSRTNSTLVRIMFQVFAIVFAIDLCAFVDANTLNSEMIIFGTVLVSAIFQSFYSLYRICKYNKELINRGERIALFINLIAVGIVIIACSNLEMSHGLAYNPFYRASTSNSDGYLFATIFKYIGLIINICICSLMLFTDKNVSILPALTLSVMALLSASISGNHHAIILCIVFGALAVICTSFYKLLEHIDKEEAIKGSFISSIIMTIGGCLYGFNDNLGWLPLLLCAVALLILYAFNKKISFLYGAIITSAFSLTFGSFSIAKIIGTDEAAAVGSQLAPYFIPLAALFCGHFQRVKFDIPNKSTELVGLKLVKGSIIGFLILSFILDLGDSTNGAGFVFYLIFQTIFIFYTAITKLDNYTIAGIGMLLLRVLMFTSLASNAWVWVMVIALCIIVGVFIALYREANSKNKPKQVANPQAQNIPEAGEQKIVQVQNITQNTNAAKTNSEK